MSILSDRQIRELCVPPPYMVTELFASPQDPMHDAFILPYERTYPSYLPGGKIKKAMMERLGSVRGAMADRSVPGVIDYRETTDEEKAAFTPMISPFEPNQVRTRQVRSDFDVDRLGPMPGWDTPKTEKVISYGLSSYGYDVCCSDEFKIFTNLNSTVVDPKNFNSKNFVDVKAGEDGCVIIPPNSFALARTKEYFRIPRDVLVVCLGKSTYARCGIVVNVTPLEPEWDGHVTLEFSNTTPLPAKIYANEGCAQMLFFRGEEPCEVSYADRGGKYQGQTGVTLPKA